MTERATAKVFIDNQRVRVTEWRFAPGAVTGRDRDERDCVVVPMVHGRLAPIEDAPGSYVKVRASE